MTFFVFQEMYHSAREKKRSIVDLNLYHNREIINYYSSIIIY